MDCSDSFATRYAVNAACCAAGTPLVEGGVLGVERAGDGDPAGGERVLPLRLPRAAAAGPSCAEAGVLGPAAGVIGSLMALEALRLLSGRGGAAAGRVPAGGPRRLEFTRVAVARRRRAVPTAALRVPSIGMLGLGTVA